jgi:flotillin
MFTTLLILLGIVIAAVITFLIVTSCYYRCPSNKILVVYGRLGNNGSVKCYHGGGSLVWPIIQGATFLDLTPMTISVPLKSALSFQNIRINIPSNFTVGVSSAPQLMENAAVRLLGLNRREIEAMASEIIFGQLRVTVASLTIEQINQDRESFLAAIRNHVIPELGKIGLDLINVNITDIHDESGYIDSIGKKAAAIAINQAKVDVAEQEKLGEVGKTEAEKERRIQVSLYQSQAVEGESRAQALVAQYKAELAQQEAIAHQKSEIAHQQAMAAILEQKSIAERRRLEAEEIVPQEIDRRKIEIAADANALQQRTLASGQADATLALRHAEAVGIQKVLAAKASGYKELLAACGSESKDLVTLLLVEKLEEVVKLQTEAIKNIKIDKITVWDSGTSDGKNSTTAHFVSNMVKSLPPLHEVAAMAGVELPSYLGSVKTETKQQE